MDDDGIEITPDDQERIDQMVMVYKRQITSLYKMAYLQGSMDSAKDTRLGLRKPTPAERFAKDAGLLP